MFPYQIYLGYLHSIIFLYLDSHGACINIFKIFPCSKCNSLSPMIKFHLYIYVCVCVRERDRIALINLYLLSAIFMLPDIILEDFKTFYVVPVRAFGTFFSSMYKSLFPQPRDTLFHHCIYVDINPLVLGCVITSPMQLIANNISLFIKLNCFL